MNGFVAMPAYAKLPFFIHKGGYGEDQVTLIIMGVPTANMGTTICGESNGTDSHPIR